MNYTWSTLLHERSRFLPGTVAVAFSATLIYLQFGMLLGLVGMTSTPIDQAPAEIWITHPKATSVDLARAIPRLWQGRLELQPEVVQTEVYFLGIVELEKPGKLPPESGQSAQDSGKPPRLCTVLGPRLADNSLGAPGTLTAPMRQLLSEKGTIVVDAEDLEGLGLTGPGDVATVLGHQVRVVDVFKAGSMRAMVMPYLVCSMETAELLWGRLPPNQTMFVLGRCNNAQDAKNVVERLRKEYPDMGIFTREQFSQKTQLHWLRTTKGGLAATVGAGLALLVGGMIIYQTLYAATMASKKEYAVLDALGITRWRMAAAALLQSFWVGLGGVILALPTTFLLAWIADWQGAPLRLPVTLLLWASGVTLGVTLLAGLAALRALHRIDSTQLLR